MKNRFPVIDLHCDTILKLLEARDRSEALSLRSSPLCVDLEKMAEGNVMIQTFALFTDRKNGHQPEHEALRLLNIFQSAREENRDSLLQICSLRDLEEVRSGRKLGALLSLEEGDVMFEDLNLLEFWYRMGVRLIALTWNYPNAIGSPNISFEDMEEIDYTRPSLLYRIETDRGLTEFGKAFVRKCEELGILVDVSHLGDKAFWDVIELSTKPVIASHSNCRSLCRVSRNLDDEQIRAIAETGGVIGVNYCADFLREHSGDLSRVSDLAAHLDHMKQTGGIDVCAIGTDFDGISCTCEAADCSEFDKLAAELHSIGWSDEEIEKAFSRNVLRILEDILPD